MEDLFGGVYKGKRVLLTGHTGFKGSWMVYWLSQMGADVLGYSDCVPTDPAHIDLLEPHIHSVTGDIRNGKDILNVMTEFQPEIVIHMAAQSLVRYGYQNPIETYETNVLGSLKVYEACRNTPSVRAIVSLTTDKVYENNEWVWGYRENDRLGGYDPYSSSKAAAEILSQSYRRSYFNLDRFGKDHHVLMATVRAGNVIGGGDWSLDRLIPDIMKATAKGETVEIRSPGAVRPWQHVLEPLAGYLLVGQRLLEEDKSVAEAWNFGPLNRARVTVEEVLTAAKKYWPEIKAHYPGNKESHMHETTFLQLDCTKAFTHLGWQPVWDNEDTFKRTTEWYKNWYQNVRLLTESDLQAYVDAASDMGLIWTK